LFCYQWRYFPCFCYQWRMFSFFIRCTSGAHTYRYTGTTFVFGECFFLVLCYL
jgi:hypothetical protein